MAVAVALDANGGGVDSKVEGVVLIALDDGGNSGGVAGTIIAMSSK